MKKLLAIISLLMIISHNLYAQFVKPAYYDRVHTALDDIFLQLEPLGKYQYENKATFEETVFLDLGIYSLRYVLKTGREDFLNSRKEEDNLQILQSIQSFDQILKKIDPEKSDKGKTANQNNNVVNKIEHQLYFNLDIAINVKNFNPYKDRFEEGTAELTQINLPLAAQALHLETSWPFILNKADHGRFYFGKNWPKTGLPVSSEKVAPYKFEFDHLQNKIENIVVTISINSRTTDKSSKDIIEWFAKNVDWRIISRLID